MGAPEDAESKGVSRRTVAKAMAWTVPVIAVAATVPQAAASAPPPPFFDFGNGKKNPGNSCTNACIPKQSYGVPVTVQNTTGSNLVIQFTNYLINNVSTGVNNVGVIYSGTTIDCAAKVAGCSLASCTVDGIPLSPTNSVCVPPNTSFVFWVMSNEFGSSPQGSQLIPWRWVNPATCTVVGSGNATSPTSPPNDFC